MIKGLCISCLGLALLLAVSLSAATGVLPTFSKAHDGTPTLLDNSVVDIITVGNAIWIATGNGIARTTDGGITWMTFNAPESFEDDAIGAIGASGSRVLAATASTTLNQTGAGLYLTDNGGDSWQYVENRLFGLPNRLAYDLAVYDSVIYAPVFGAGLLRSLDGGSSWSPVFPSTEIADDFEGDSLINEAGHLRGLMFSALVDPTHENAKIVWTGSAEGVQLFYYVSKHVKLISKNIIDIANTGSEWWYATDRGITNVNDTVLAMRSWDIDNGLPGYLFSAIAAYGDTVIAGVFDTLSHSGQGFVVTTDRGATWESKSTPQAAGTNRRVEELGFWGDEIWAACDHGGLIRSTDLGDTWSNVYFDSGNQSEDNLRNRFHCLDISPREDFVRISAGTDSGVVAFYFNPGGDLDSTAYLNLFDNATWGQKVITLATMKTRHGEEFWAGVESFKDQFGSHPATLRTTNNGFTWEHYLVGPPAVTCYDIEIGEYYGDTVIFAATSGGMRRSQDYGAHFDVLTVADFFSPTSIPIGTQFNAVEMSQYEVHVGSAGSGLGQMYLAQIGSQFLFNFRVYQPNLDPDQFDFIWRSYNGVGAVPKEDSLPGNFVVSLALQQSGDSSLVWAATRRGEDLGHPSVCYSTDQGTSWVETIADVMAWNIAFNGDTVFFAADQGLYMSTDFGANWTVPTIYDPATGRSIADDVPVYAVRMIGDRLWVGTEDGLAHTQDFENWTIIRTFVDIPATAGDDDRTFVTPNPFSPYLGIGDLKFHYKLKQNGKVTITVYDFANNIVKKVVDGVERLANVQYDDIDTWDGTNGNGEKVAAGVYFYLLETTSGEEYWGKLMVIP